VSVGPKWGVQGVPPSKALGYSTLVSDTIPHIKRIYFAYSGGQRLIWLEAEYRSRRSSRERLSSDYFSFPRVLLDFAPSWPSVDPHADVYFQRHIDLRYMCTHNTTVLWHFPITLMILLLLLLCVIWLDPTFRQTASPSIKPKFILFVYTNEVDDPSVLFARTSRGRFVIAQIYIYILYFPIFPGNQVLSMVYNNII